MSKFVKTTLATAVAGAALVAVGVANAGIANTKHNFSTSGGGPNTTAGTDEICVFCHTPHGGDNSAPVPLWNKKLTDKTTFTTYDQLGTSTLDAAIAEVGSVSLACLTCHDGAQAIDNLINAPGSGGYTADGGGVNGMTNANGWTWTTADGSISSEGQFLAGPDTGGTVIFNLGKDLTNDHPIGVQYGGGGYSATNRNGSGPNPSGTRDADFVPATPITGLDRWFIDNETMAGNEGSINNEFDKWDFKLYTRTENRTDNNGNSTANEPEPFVECGSCHDPHLETTTFLRISTAVQGGPSNSGSKVCLTCHTK